LLNNHSVHEPFRAFAVRADTYGVTVGRYVLMPDHVYLFAAFSANAVSLPSWVKSLKNSLSKCLRQQGIPSPHFQKDYFDHVLRSTESLQEKSEYMFLNPVRAGLVERPEDWEFQGEIFRLENALED